MFPLLPSELARRAYPTSSLRARTLNYSLISHDSMHANELPSINPALSVFKTLLNYLLFDDYCDVNYKKTTVRPVALTIVV